MNRQERAVMEKVYACINRMSGMTPSNPADLRLKALLHDRMVEASRLLTLSLSCVNFGDLPDAHEYADKAILALDK